jgi:TRAP-type C4-dicarboxylate transport system substrate-binding protein
MLNKAIVAALMAAGMALPAAAEPIILKLNSPAPPRSYLHSGVFEPWAQALEQASDGTLKIQMFYGGTLGNFAVTYDRVIDGVADIGFILTAFAGGKFKQQDVAALPFETKDANEAAAALWKIYEKGLTSAEFEQVKLLGIWTFPNSALHTKEPLRTIDEVKGKKLVTTSAIAAKVATHLGATPVTFRPDEAYQAISRGITDGCIMPFTGMETFKIHEVAKYHLDAALGGDAAILFMNKQRYDGLPAKAKEALDKNSYLSLSQRLGAKTTAEWSRARDGVKDTVSVLSADQEKIWKGALEPMAKEFVSSTPEGAKVLEAFRAEVAAMRSGGK